MSVANSSNHSRESDEIRARKYLPADFGEDEPEVIQLREKQAAAKEQQVKTENALGTFSEKQGARNQSMWMAEDEINRIDDGRPKLLARLILEGGDFTQDANQQRRRRELVLLVERYRLASPVIAQMREDLVKESKEAGQHYQHISNQIRDVLDRLRLERVAAQH